MRMDPRDRQDDQGGEDELRARLDAYAASRLEPDPDAAARTRMAVMAEAHRSRLARQMIDHAAGASLLGRLFRRPALAAATALVGLAVLTVGTVAAASPGGPLYGTRVWVETLSLPSDATARADAELDRLQARLDEAAAAAANGNGGAVTAALEAYRQTLAEAFAAAGNDPTREGRLVAELGRHLAVLDALAARVPANAAAAIDQAVQRTESRIDAITGAPGQPNGTPRPGNTNTGNPSHMPNPGQLNGTPKPGGPNPGNPGHTPNPVQLNGTPKPGGPNHSPDPAQPNGTPKPGTTPNPNGTPPGN